MDILDKMVRAKGDENGTDKRTNNFSECKDDGRGNIDSERCDDITPDKSGECISEIVSMPGFDPFDVYGSLKRNK